MNFPRNVLESEAETGSDVRMARNSAGYGAAGHGVAWLGAARLGTWFGAFGQGMARQVGAWLGTWRGAAGHGLAGCGMVRQGSERGWAWLGTWSGAARRVMARNMAWLGRARQGGAGSCKARNLVRLVLAGRRRGKVGRGKARNDARRGAARQSWARQGKARNSAWLGRAGSGRAGHGSARLGWARRSGDIVKLPTIRHSGAVNPATDNQRAKEAQDR